MNKLLLGVIVVVVSKVGYDAFMRHQGTANVDKNMAKIAAEINGKLPLTDGEFRIEQVEYSDRTMRYHGAMLNGREMTAEMQAAVRQRLQANYCNGSALVLKNAKVSVEYSIRKDGIRSINDKVSAETWTIVARPETCV